MLSLIIVVVEHLLLHALLRLLLMMCQHRRLVHAVLSLELRASRILLRIALSDTLLECASHRHVLRKIGTQALVEVGGTSLKVLSKSSVLKW